MPQRSKPHLPLRDRKAAAGELRYAPLRGELRRLSRVLWSGGAGSGYRVWDRRRAGPLAEAMTKPAHSTVGWRRAARRGRGRCFSLLEIIAVLLILAMLATVALPRFMSVAILARNGVAQAGINEAKASLSVAFVKAYLAAAGGDVSVNAVMVAADFADGGTVAFGDINVRLDEGVGGIQCQALDVKGVNVSAPVGFWQLPVP